ncbi:FRG domain-containing protein [Burkholderia cepacia]|uniref:FRG domain-containing protein n=1 Tax=Burkholderia cepacia TaxID=292 RepID=UPI00352773C0
MAFYGQFFGVFRSVGPTGTPHDTQFILNVDRNRQDRGIVLVARPSSGAKPYGIGVRIESVFPEFVARAESFYQRNDQGVPCLVPFPVQDYQPIYAELRGKFDEKNCRFMGEWKVSDGRNGIAGFGLVETEHGLGEVPVCQTWNDYKVWATNVRGDEKCPAAFRGQSDNRWKLESSFHRAGRNDLWHYNAHAVTQLHQQLESTSLTLDRSRPGDFARLIAIAQHHGFPTPLLDWTLSPYIAAYFAFSDALEKLENSDATHVRVYALTKNFATKYSPQIVGLTELEAGIAYIHISSRDNPRLLAQQGVFTLSTVKDIERYLTARVVTPNNDFLLAVDIPVSEAKTALSDLAYMGITPATLFPGIDGICKRLKQQMLIGQI